MMHAVKAMVKRVPQIRKVIAQRDQYAQTNAALGARIQETEAEIARLVAENAKRNAASSPMPAAGIELADLSVLEVLDDDSVVSWVPIELCYTEDKEHGWSTVANKTPEWIHFNARWENLNIARLKPHGDLYRFFRGGGVGEEAPASYYDWFRNCFELRGEKATLRYEDLIEKRCQECQEWSKRFSDTKSWAKDAPRGAWNKRGYFNIHDGHHRTTFLYRSGFRRIPMKISTSDYLTWRNDAQVKRVCDCMAEQESPAYYTPILNPFFYHIVGYRDCCYQTRLDCILEFFNSYRFAGMKMLDIGANKCYYAQHFYREGAQVTALEPDPNHFRLGEQLNKLHYCHVNFLPCKFEEFDTDETYDIGIMLTVFYHFAKYEDLRRVWHAKIDKFIDRFILWESGDAPEAEKADIMGNTKFKHYSRLASTYGTGKVRELGIFSVHEIGNMLGRCA